MPFLILRFAHFFFQASASALHSGILLSEVRFRFCLVKQFSAGGMEPTEMRGDGKMSVRLCSSSVDLSTAPFTGGFMSLTVFSGKVCVKPWLFWCVTPVISIKNTNQKTNCAENSTWGGGYSSERSGSLWCIV